MDPGVSKRKFEHAAESIRGLAADFINAAAWDLLELQYPLVAVVFTHPRSKRRVGFRFQFDEWDELPPSLSLFDPETKDELPWARWPQQGWAAAGDHPTTHKPFLCLPGIREYHIHSSHLNDRWDNLKGRDSYALPYIVHRVHYKFGETNG